MPDAVEMTTELSDGNRSWLGVRRAEEQTLLTDWGERWMGLDPAAARGWHSNGTDLIGGSLLWEAPATGSRSTST